MKMYKKVTGLLSVLVTIMLLILPFIILLDFEYFKSTGYFGYFIATYVGYGIYILPFLVTTLNPILLILIGSIGFTLDEIFTWYAGQVSTELVSKTKYHKKIQHWVEYYGIYAIFVFGLLPLPGIFYAISGFAAGHYKISLTRFLIANFSGKLIRTTIIVFILVKIIN